MSFKYVVLHFLCIRIAIGAKFDDRHFLYRIGSAGGTSAADEDWRSASSIGSHLEVLGADVESSIRHSWTSLLAGSGNVTDDDADAVPARRQQMYFRPVSTTLNCVMLLTISSLVVYTLLSIFRNVDELSAAFQPSTNTQTFTIAARVGTFAPMMCMLFVACRMYVLATTEGLGEPPGWVKSCMWLCVCGLALQHILVLALPQYVRTSAKEEADYDMTFGKTADGKKPDGATEDAMPDTNLQDATGEFNDVHPVLDYVKFESGEDLFWIGQILSLAFTYVGIGGVIYGIFTFPAQTTNVSPAVLCTIALSCLYFLSTLLLWSSRALPKSENEYGQLSPFTDASLAMSTAVRKAPMFAVLFLASRMRALQLDPPYGMPPVWMQSCFYGITILIYVESIVALIVGLTGKKDKGYYGVYIFHSAGKTLSCIQHLVSIASALLVIPIILGVTWMPDHFGYPAPLSTTLRCVLVFQWLYFGVCFWQSLILLAEESAEVDWMLNKQASIAAGISLNLAPLLSILFVATRMRALQITQQLGDPPGWAQDAMDVAVFATCVQAICCLLMPWFVINAVKVDADGNPDYDLEPMVGAYALAVVKYSMLMLLHSSVIAICVSVFVMTPESAHSGNRFFNSSKAILEGLASIMVIFFLALLFSSAKVIGMAVKFAIEAVDKTLLGVDIHVKDVALNFFKGYVKIVDFVVEQPEDVVVYTREANGKLKKDVTGARCDWANDYLAKVHLVLVKVNLWRILSTLGKEFELQNLSIVGIQFNFEKPSFSTDHDSNMEYITNHMEYTGLIPPPKDPKAKKEEEATKKKEEPQKADPKKDDSKKNEPRTEKADAPKIMLHKISLGNFGVKVTLKKKYSFNPHIPEITFPDIQRDVFGGREDLTPAETVACIVKAVALRIWHKASSDIPREVLRLAEGVAKNAKDIVIGSVTNAAASMKPCIAGCTAPPVKQR